MKKLFIKTAELLGKSRRGATATEYVVIVALIALTIVVGLVFLGGGINMTFTNIVDIVQGAIGT